jgi:hypothetical protein
MEYISSTRSRISPPPIERKAKPLESTIKEMIQRKGGKRSQFNGSYLTG